MRIVLSRTDRIGDLILTTPAIATVRASFPQAHVTLVTSRYNRIAVERNTDVDELISVESGQDPKRVGHNLAGADLAIALAPRAPDLRLIGATKARRRFGYTYVRRWLARISAPLYVNEMMISEADPELCERDPHRVVRHEVDQLLDLVGLAGARTRVPRLRIDVRDEDRAAVAGFGGGFVVLHLGMRWFSGGSTPESTLELAAALRARCPLVISCPPECESYIAPFEAAGHQVAHGLPFHQWAALFEASRCVVTVDTGATHVASAMRRPTLVAFEHRYFRLNSQEWSPYGVPSVLVRKPGNEDAAALAQLRAEIVDGVTQLIDA